jgi:diacylglycerol kinase (ATP)
MATKSVSKAAPKSVRQVAPAARPPADLRPTLSPAEAQPLNYHTNINFWRGRQLSLIAALEGVVYTFRTQPNVWIELAALAVVAIAGVWFGIGPLEWALLGLTIAMILALEAVNTAIEAVVDLASPQLHPLAKIAKDAAAGAMVIAVLGSIFVAACIFGPRLWALLL